MCRIKQSSKAHCLHKMIPKIEGARLAGSISRTEKRELLATMRDRYQAFSREDRNRILHEFTAVASHHRKRGIRLPPQSEDGLGKVRAVRGMAHVATWRSVHGKHHTAWPCSVPRLQFSLNFYPSTCWMVQRLTSRRLASSRWLTPFERSLIEFRHHSLKASTIESWSLPVGVAVSKSSARDRNSTPARCRPSITCSP